MTRTDRLALKHITSNEQTYSTAGMWATYFTIAFTCIPNSIGFIWYVAACVILFIGLGHVRDHILLMIDEKRAKEATPELSQDDDS